MNKEKILDMNLKKATTLAIKKLIFQVKIGARDGYSDEDVEHYANEILYLHNTFNGR